MTLIPAPCSLFLVEPACSAAAHRQCSGPAAAVQSADGRCSSAQCALLVTGLVLRPISARGRVQSVNQTSRTASPAAPTSASRCLSLSLLHPVEMLDAAISPLCPPAHMPTMPQPSRRRLGLANPSEGPPLGV